MHAPPTPVTISAIVPMYNAAGLIDRCLAPLVAMRERREIDEIIVVDDCSTDDSPNRVGRYSQIKLLRRNRQGGPGAARNTAAEIAAGRYLWFVDSDVIVADDAARVLRQTLADGAPAAVNGSYDDAPAATNFLSQYKNLVHHYYHQRGRSTASTFWAGCGAIERDTFVRLGGFDEQRFPYPSIEDIDLGYRIIAAGGHIVMQPVLQGKHLKEWRAVNLIHTEIFRRAFPWSRLMLQRRAITNDLNVGRGERMRAVLAGGSVIAIVGWLAGLAAGWLPAVVVAGTVAVNTDFVRFFARKRGAVFAARAFLFHQLYYLYGSAAFAAASLVHVLGSGRGPRVIERSR